MINDPIEVLARNIVIMYGYSGSGKGEEGKVLNSLAEKDKRELTTLSSGELFRATEEKIKKTPKENRGEEEGEIADLLEKTMGQGHFVPTLDAVMPPLVEEFKRYIKATLSGEKVALVLDGFVRIGKYVYKEKVPGLEGQIIASQIEQVAEGFVRALRDVLHENSEFQKRFDPTLLQDILSHENLDYKKSDESHIVRQIALEVVLQANHTIIDITKEDADAFMRLRVRKSLDKLGDAIKKGRQEKDGLDQVVELLDQVNALYSGKYSVDGSNIIIDNSLEDNTLRHLDQATGRLLDTKLLDITRNMYEALGEMVPEKVEPSVAIAKVQSRVEDTLGIKVEMDAVRKDDMLSTTRERRLLAYQDTLKDIIGSRLGIPLIYSEDRGSVLGVDTTSYRLRTLDRFSLIENGASRGITYPILKDNVAVAGQKIFGRFTSLEVESSPVERK